MMIMRSIVLSTFFISAVSAASQDLCFGKTEVATKLNFFNSKVTKNKLHDGGDLRYTGVGKVRGKNVDLVVSVAKGSQYSTTKPTNNGKSGYFGNINMMTLENSDKYDGEGTFDFCFRDSTTNELTTVDSFRWSFFDVDERGGTANGIKEMIVMDTEQAEDFILYPNTKKSEIQLVCEDSGKTPTASNPCRKGERTQFKSSTGGKGSDNPRNPNKLTEQQKKRSILYTFKNKSCFTVQFRHYCPVKKCKWYGGGNFQFAGEADELIEEGECITKAPKPTQQPTRLPTLAPTKRPTNPPTNPPTKEPTNPPTNPPTKEPTNPPTSPPTKEPTNPPTNPPTKEPSNPPTNPPTKEPSNPPTNPPTGDPTNPPTNPPTTEPTNPPTKEPTRPPTDSPTFVEDTVGEPELCLGKTRVATNLDFFNSVVTENDLQNGGVLKYEGIGKVRDRNVDLIVSVMPGTTYTTPRNSNGKGESDLFGNISLFTVKGDLKSGQGNFKFCFHDSQTGDLTKVDSFRWSVYDVDDRNAAANGIKEKMSMDVSQASDFILYPNQEESEIQLVCEDSGLPAPCAPGERTVFHASTKGVGGDNPTDPNNLTEQQKKRSVVFTFHDTDCWEFTYDHYCRIEAEEGKKCRWYGGGNFLFAGDANEIIEEGECLTSPPTVSPSTGAPTQVPTEDIEQINPPSPTMCPEDVKVSRIDGVTPFESSAVEIVSQDAETVTVKLTNAWESVAADAVDAVYYNYRENLFNWKCYEETDVFTGQTIDTITIRCNVMSPEAFLEICIADSISNEFLAAEDDATIPKCCHADTPPQSATVCYTVELSCKSTCTDGIEEGVLQAQNTNRSLRGGI